MPTASAACKCRSPELDREHPCQVDTVNWYRLTPDPRTSFYNTYVNGTWTKIASLASNYGPRFFASAVLPDRRFIIEGGEYNFLNEVRTTLGAIYDPLLDTWIAVTPPSGWGNIGDASGHRARYRRIHAQRVLHGAVGVP